MHIRGTVVTKHYKLRVFFLYKLYKTFKQLFLLTKLN